MAVRPRCGVNVTHWLPERALLRRLLHKPLRRDDLARLADWGFDHVRLPVCENQAYDRRRRRRHVTFDALNRVLDWCAELGLLAIVDLHRLRQHNQRTPTPNDVFSNPEAAASLVQTWCDLSDALAHRPIDRVVYDLMAEARSPTPEAWFDVQAAVLAAIRQREPHRVACYGPHWYRMLPSMDTMRVIDDPALLLVFHHYRPGMLTHYGLRWSRATRGYRGPVRYPGVPIPDEGVPMVHPDVRAFMPSWNDPVDAATTAALLAVARAKAAQVRQPLYCPEFGCSRFAPAELRLAWLRDALSLFKANGIGWALWEYRGDFGLIAPDRQPTEALPLVLEYCRRSP